ncbi:cytochrome o ubiquinol oxidase subunit III [Campylobacter coli HN-CCD07046]|nr:cytochrome o ubiquinol oxidase subunit III [Campylobacter coli HN-CCD07046]
MIEEPKSFQRLLWFFILVSYTFKKLDNQFNLKFSSYFYHCIFNLKR